MKNQDNISCKVVLVGDTGVGKTSIIERYINNRYDENQKTTLVSSYTFKKIDIKKYNKSVSLDIWDTAGQEVYRSLSKNFYLNASIGILVYDIRRKESFNAIKDYWYDQLKISGEENMIFGVAGNKCDLFQEEEVTEEEGKKFAKEIGGIFQLTSCKESIGIDDLFYECGKKYLETNNLVTKNDKDENNNTIKITSDKNKNKANETKRNKCC